MIQFRQLIGLILFVMMTSPVRSQPTGHQRLYLQIKEQGRTIPFDQQIEKGDYGHYPILRQGDFQLIDKSRNATGFGFYPGDGFIHKILMTDDHRLQVVRNWKDTMNIEILNCFRVYFLEIDFRPGDYRLYVNDGKEYS